jgi:hypothetical protein
MHRNKRLQIHAAYVFHVPERDGACLCWRVRLQCGLWHRCSEAICRSYSNFVSVVVVLPASVVVRVAASLQSQICHRDVRTGCVIIVLSWHHVWSKQECRFASGVAAD